MSKRLSRESTVKESKLPWWWPIVLFFFIFLSAPGIISHIAPIIPDRIIAWLFGEPSQVSWMANIGSIFGFFIDCVSIYIAVLIYRFQQRDLTDTLKKLEHLAVSFKKINMAGLEEELKDVESWVKQRTVSHALVVSRYSALPAFWIGASMAGRIKSILEDVPKKVFIGPDESLLNTYAGCVADFIMTPSNLNGLKKKEQKEEIQRRWLPQGNEDRETVINKILEDYKVRTAELKHLVPSQGIERMAVNAIILKCTDPPNHFESHFELFFFSEPTTYDPATPQMLLSPVIYRASVSLMAKLWKHEIDSIKQEVANDDELQNFLTGFWNE